MVFDEKSPQPLRGVADTSFLGLGVAKAAGAPGVVGGFVRGVMPEKSGLFSGALAPPDSGDSVVSRAIVFWASRMMSLFVVRGVLCGVGVASLWE